MKSVEFLVVFNRRSGSVKVRDCEKMIRDFFRKKSISCEFHFLDGEFDLPKIEFEKLLVGGGDGTLRRAAEFFLRQKIDRPLAFLPTGSANIFAQIYKIPRSPRRNLRRLLRARKIKIPLGILNGEVFLIAAVFGRLAEFSLDAEKYGKQKIGFAAYIFAATRSFFHFPYQILCVNSREIAAHSVLVFLAPAARKFAIVKNARAPLHAFVARNKNFRGLLHIFYRLHFLRKKSELVEIAASKKIKLSGDFEKQIHLDGDRVRARSEI